MPPKRVGSEPGRQAVALGHPRALWWKVVALALVLGLGLPPLVGGYRALCAGPVDTYPVVVAVRDEARSEAAAPAAPQAPPPPAVFRADVLDLVLRVKQSDPVAFSVHVVVGLALEAGRCPAAATSDQWRKVAGHAWFEAGARVAAAGLARTAGAAFGDEVALRWLARYAAAEPWHAENLARVQRAYRQQSP